LLESNTNTSNSGENASLKRLNVIVSVVELIIGRMMRKEPLLSTKYIILAIGKPFQIFFDPTILPSK
jgi:hypothetical protein